MSIDRLIDSRYRGQGPDAPEPDLDCHEKDVDFDYTLEGFSRKFANINEIKMKARIKWYGEENYNHEDFDVLKFYYLDNGKEFELSNVHEYRMDDLRDAIRGAL